jgi:hypothetical protein
MGVEEWSSVSWQPVIVDLAPFSRSEPHGLSAHEGRKPVVGSTLAGTGWEARPEPRGLGSGACFHEALCLGVGVRTKECWKPMILHA